MENQEENSSDKKGFVEQFGEERNEWTATVRDIASRFKVVENLAEVQVDLYSRRQQAVEYMQQLTVLKARLNKKYETEWRKAYEDLTINQDIRYNERERAKFSTEKTSADKMKIEILQAHIDFFRETTKTIDSMIFGVKHRIEIEDFKRGNK